MSIFGFLRKKGENNTIGAPPYKIVTEWFPYKLYANKKSSSSLSVKIKNNSKESQLTSVELELPNKLSFDGMGISRKREIKLGDLPPDSEKEIKFDVINSLDADKGEYSLILTVSSHYRDYDHFLNTVKKTIVIEVV